MNTTPTPTPSLGTLALLLIRLDGRCGDPEPWVKVDALAATHRMPLETVRAGLQSLWNDGHVRCMLGADGLIERARSAVKG